MYGSPPFLSLKNIIECENYALYNGKWKFEFYCWLVIFYIDRIDTLVFQRVLLFKNIFKYCL